MAYLNHPDADNILCSPDNYLSQSQLERLFSDFNHGLDVSLSRGAVFSNLINTVRQAYAGEIMTLQREIIQQSQGRGSQPVKSPAEHNNPSTERTQDLEIDTTILKEFLAAIRLQRTSVAKPLPADTDFISVDTTTNPRRDMLTWGSYNFSGWFKRFEFKAFRFPEVGTVCITVVLRNGSSRVIARLNDDTVPPGWAHRLQFHVYEHRQPNTEMISVGYRNEFDGCILTRGDHVNKLPGWDEAFTFWVPKQ